MWGWLTFKAKTPDAAQKAQMRRLVRWRNRIWRHLAALPIGTLIGAGAAAVCHLWPDRYPVFCELVAKLLGNRG